MKAAMAAAVLAVLLIRKCGFKKKIKNAWIAVITVLAFLLPFRFIYKDGGTRQYWSPLFQIYMWHQLDVPDDDINIYFFPDNFSEKERKPSFNRRKRAERILNDVESLGKADFGEWKGITYSKDKEGWDGGVVRIAVKYENSKITEKLEKSACWHSLPVILELQDYFKVNSGLVNEYIPAENGYWMCFNYSEETHTAEVYKEGSFFGFLEHNYTIAIYDSDDDILYIWHVET